MAPGSGTNSVQTRFLHQQNKAYQFRGFTVNRIILYYGLYYGPRTQDFRDLLRDSLIRMSQLRCHSGLVREWSRPIEAVLVITTRIGQKSLYESFMTPLWPFQLYPRGVSGLAFTRVRIGRAAMAFSTSTVDSYNAILPDYVEYLPEPRRWLSVGQTGYLPEHSSSRTWRGEGSATPGVPRYRIQVRTRIGILSL